MFGEIPIAPYGTPSTQESADSIRNLISSHDVIVLDHHGAVAAGKSLEDAFFKMEKLEHAASILLSAKQIGRIDPLTPIAVKKLELLKQELTEIEIPNADATENTRACI